MLAECAFLRGLDSASPFLNAVGMDVEMSSIVVKGDKDI
jgi:hypothetical protein